MRTHLLLIALAVGLPPATSRAGAAFSEELGLGSSPAAGSQPKTGTVTNALRGAVDLSEQWSLKLGFDVTWSTPTTSDIAPKLRPRAETSVSILPGVAFAPDEHFSFELGLSLSPRSTTQADSQVTITPTPTPTPTPALGAADAAALISSVTSSYGASLWLGYDTAGDSDFETSASVSVAATHFDSTQKIAALEGRNDNVLGPLVLAQYCQTHVCSKQLKALLGPHPDRLDQISLGGSATETLWHDTDLAATFTWYLYGEDPTQIGYFSLATAGKGAVSFGAGMPLAPPLWTLRPDISHRFDPVLVDLYYQHTQYVAGEGTGELAGARAQVKLSKAVRAWVTGNIQRDRDGGGNLVPTRSLSAGFKVRW